MVDLAIAANFARELTEEQFAEQRRTPRRGAATSDAANGPAPAARKSGRDEASRMRRTLARLAQVRG